MNRIERRIAGTNAGRPGAPVCNPGKPGSNIGMLGGSPALYQSPQQRAQNAPKVVNGLAILNSHGDRISRIEQKLNYLEQNQALYSSDLNGRVTNNNKTIDLMNGSYREQMNQMKKYIQELESKIAKLDQEKLYIPVAPPTDKPVECIENVSLEIIEN